MRADGRLSRAGRSRQEPDRAGESRANARRTPFDSRARKVAALRMIKFAHAHRHRPAQPDGRRSSRQRRAHPRRRSPPAGAPAPSSSSLPNCRSADIRPRICCCGLRSRRVRARARCAVAASTGLTVLVGFPERCRRQALQRARPSCATAQGRACIASRRCPTTRCSTSSAISPAARAMRGRRRPACGRRRHLRGHLVSGAGAQARDAGAAGAWSCPTARRTTRGSRRRARAGRADRARARPACRSSTSIASAARTSWCSTARRS